MSVLAQLSSQIGERSEQANRRIAARCLEAPGLLAQIAEGLHREEAALLGDCAEVMTKVAEHRPDWVAPYTKSLVALIAHPTTRVRWEAMHALALIAALTPKTITALLPRLADILHRDPSVIVRDYATVALTHYASTGKAAALKAYPLLLDMLSLWQGKQAAHALQGLAHVARLTPKLRAELGKIGERHQAAGKAMVRKAARTLSRAVMDAEQ